MFRTWGMVACLLAAAIAAPPPFAIAQNDPPPISIGIIGLDTSHAIEFTRLIQDPDSKFGCQVRWAYPHGSRDIESSVSRIPGYTQEIQKLGVEIVDSLEELVRRSDALMLETNDGRPHLEQALVALRTGKPIFIDKPVAGSLVDAIALFEAAERLRVPIFSASCLRFANAAQQARSGELVGPVLGCDTYSPCTIEPTHPDLFWYGIHGVEQLFTVMGTGCISVARSSTQDHELVTGVWEDGRIGSFRGLRAPGARYGGTVFGREHVASSGGNEGYAPLVGEICRFFATRTAPVDPDETIEIYAFMEAADQSKQNAGAVVALRPLLESARRQAIEKIDRLVAEGALPTTPSAAAGPPRR